MSATTKQQYFDEIKEWSERKLNILEKYLEAATKIMASLNQEETRVYYIDGFAGVGIYENGDKGSPVRAAELAKQIRDSGKSYTLKCINVEEKKNNFANLQKSTDIFGNLVINLPGAFAANVDTILKEIKKTPSICFLDPFGVEGLDWDAVIKMIQRTGPTDFWIRFDTEYVLRLNGFYESSAPEAAAKLNILTRTYGINNITQIHNSLRGISTETRKKNAVDLYQTLLHEAFKKIKGNAYVASYNIRGIDGDEKYYLVFASADQKGIVLASNIVYGIEESYQRELQEYKANLPQTSMFDAFGLDPSEEEIFNSKVEELKEEIWRKYRGKREMRRNIHAHLVTESRWFGKMKAPHMTRVFKELSNPINRKIISKTGNFGDEDAIFTFAE